MPESPLRGRPDADAIRAYLIAGWRAPDTTAANLRDGLREFFGISVHVGTVRRWAADWSGMHRPQRRRPNPLRCSTCRARGYRCAACQRAYRAARVADHG